MEALSAHLHEHHDAIVKWSWKLFCRKWARLIDWAADEEERKENERIEREYAEMKRQMTQHGG